MERQNEPLTQKKPWSELTEEERAAIRESWKHTLPEKFDVFYTGILVSVFEIEFPGNLYVKEDVCIPLDSLTVCGHFISDGDIIVGKMSVQGDCIIRHTVESLERIDVAGLLDCYDVETCVNKIYASDYVCRCYEEEI